jgi:pimeloyl-ACP methyl ester carboxylesterase
VDSGRQRFATVDGRPVSVLEWGPPPREAERRVVLVHGLGSAAIEWGMVAGPLAERLGASVTAIDLPGYGRSRRVGASPTIRGYEGAVTKLLERDGPAVLMGQSMGGAVSVRVAAHSPELVPALVLVDPALPSATVSLRRRATFIREFVPYAAPGLGRWVVHRRHRRLGPDGIVADHFVWNTLHPDRVDSELRAELLALAHERWQHQREAAAVYALSARSVTMYVIAGERRDLDTLACPTLLVHAENDRLIPLRDADDAARRHPRWDFRVVPECGHAVQVEKPDVLLDMVTSWIPAQLAKPAPSSPSV